MTSAAWWGERRYGLFIHANLATVPAWAPIGEHADWYWSHLGDDLPDVRLHPHPMVEVLAHHRDRWGHIAHYDDFLPLLPFDRFDAEDWARLAVDSGMGYTILVAKHHDGWCWWDAPGTTRTMVDAGPKRNVLAEYAAACERNDLTFGAYYSLLDWGDDRYPGDDYVSDVLHPHVTDLVERYGSRMMWGDGHWGHGPEHWRTRDLLDRLRVLDADLVVNDRWWAAPGDVPPGSPPSVRTFEHVAPADIVHEPWELCRGIGAGFGYNRTEHAEHHLTAFGIVSLLTEVVAKGGNLLLSVGPTADGTIPELQATPLRAAGRWVRAHEDIVNRSRPWVTWGDERVRYVTVDGTLHAIDLSGRGHFAALDPAAHRVETVTRLDAASDPGEDGGGLDARPVAFRQDDEGLHLDPVESTAARARHQHRARHHHAHHHQAHQVGEIGDIAVYRIDVSAVERPVALFEHEDRIAIPLGPLVADALPGDIISLGDSAYRGPATVPAGVVLRGVGRRTVIDGGGAVAVTLEQNARLEHVHVTGAAARIAWLPTPAVELAGPYATVLGCSVDGHVIARADDCVIRATTAAGIVADHCERLIVSRCQLDGMRWDVGIELDGGADHEIDSCTISDHLCAIRASDTTGAVVRGCTIRGRWWGVHLERTERAHVHGNRVTSTMRAIDVDGGTQALIDGNAVFDGDSGCLLERGASGCQVSGNYWERCRIGLLAWDATGLHQQDNLAIELHETDHATITGP